MPSKQERCRSTFFLVSLECFRKKLEPRRCIRVSSLTRRIHARLVHAGWCLKAKRADKGGILLTSCAPHIFLLALAYLVLRARRGSSLMLHSRHTSSICLTDVKELPTSLHHCRFICLFHLPLPPTSKRFQRRFTTVASSLSLHQCRFFTVTMSRRYLGATRHQKHYIIFLEPNSGRAES